MKVWTYYDVAVVTADDAEHAAQMLEHKLGYRVNSDELDEVDQGTADVVLLGAM